MSNKIAKIVTTTDNDINNASLTDVNKYSLIYQEFIDQSHHLLHTYDGTQCVPFNASKHIKTIGDTTYTILPSDNGKTLIFTSSSPITLSINKDVQHKGINFEVVQYGTGIITFDGTATLNVMYGNTGTVGTGTSYNFTCITTTAILVSSPYYVSRKNKTLTVVTSSSGAVDLDLSLGEYFSLTLTENISSMTFSNVPPASEGITFMFKIKQHASSAKTVTWPSSFKWADGNVGVVSTTLDAIDVFTATSFDGGVTWCVTLANGFI